MCKNSAKDEFIQAETCTETSVKLLAWMVTITVNSSSYDHRFICLQLS